MKKSELKNLIKECIVEVLSEGLASQQIFESRRNKPSSSKDVGVQQRQRLNPVLEQTVKSVARGSSSLADILADTANTTLQNQLSAEKGMSSGYNSDGIVVIPHADMETQIVANSEPTDLFTESAKNWASLAFAPLQRKP